MEKRAAVPADLHFRNGRIEKTILAGRCLSLPFDFKCFHLLSAVPHNPVAAFAQAQAGSVRRAGQFGQRLSGNSATVPEALWATNTARLPEHAVQLSSWHHQSHDQPAIYVCSANVSIGTKKVNGMINTNERSERCRSIRRIRFRQASVR